MKIGTLVEKNHADSKYDSHFALRAIPDYEPLKTSSMAVQPTPYNPQGLHLVGYILPKNKPCRAQNSLIQGPLLLNVW